MIYLYYLQLHALLKSVYTIEFKCTRRCKGPNPVFPLAWSSDYICSWHQQYISNFLRSKVHQSRIAQWQVVRIHNLRAQQSSWV